jgi:glycine cleavage system H protein
MKKTRRDMMKELNELSFPDDVRYAKSHEWARLEGDKIKVGISDYAQDQLGDIVFVELPEVGDTFGKGEEYGTVESVKAVSELYMPVAGEIVAINDALEDAPEKVNNSPYGDGWMIEVKADAPSEIDDLMDNNAYLETLKG